MDMSSSLFSAQVEQRRIVLSSYYVVGSFSVFTWDILYNLSHDYDLIKTHGTNLASIIYFTSRLSTLGFLSVGVVILTSHVSSSDCARYRIAEVTFYNVFIASTLLLSYFRVCAIWNKHRVIVFVFGFLWLSSVAGGLTTISGLTEFSEPPLCLDKTSGNYIAASVLGPTVNHIIVFSAITYGLCKPRSSSFLDITKRYRVYLFGDTLPAFSKALLQTSQICYLVVVICGLVTVGWFFRYHEDPGYRLAIVPIYTALVNIMFSWVFRKAKLGVFTVIVPPENFNGDGINLRDLQRAQSTVFRPTTFRPAEDTKSNKNFQTPSERDYDYGDQEYHYIVQQSGVHAKGVTPLKIDVEQVVEFGDDESTGADKRHSSHGSITLNTAV